ncbi:MAG: hypothetical protein ACLQT5_12805 [Steroidobacteraceae bacterium]
MFHFERSAVVKNPADMPAAVQFATQVTSYVNRQHSLNMRFGVELFGAARVHWYFDAESLDKLNQLNTTLLQDREYFEILNKARALWTDGGLKDTIISLAP